MTTPKIYILRLHFHMIIAKEIVSAINESSSRDRRRTERGFAFPTILGWPRAQPQP
jgi:hypothetical protein